MENAIMRTTKQIGGVPLMKRMLSILLAAMLLCVAMAPLATAGAEQEPGYPAGNLVGFPDPSRPDHGRHRKV